MSGTEIKRERRGLEGDREGERETGREKERDTEREIVKINGFLHLLSLARFSICMETDRIKEQCYFQFKSRFSSSG